LYTQTKFFNSSGKRQDAGARSTYFTGIGQFLYGVNSKLSIGFDISLRAVRNDITGSSSTNVFMFENSSSARVAITSLGPKIKIAPFKKASYIAWQSTFLIPIADSLESSPWLDYDSYIWRNQVFFDKELNRSFRLFTEFDSWIRINKDLNKDKHSLETPVKGFLSYYPHQNFSVYTMVEASPSWGTDVINAYYLQAGIGAKYLLLPVFEVEILYTNFLIGKNKGAGQTYSLGFRLVK